MVVIGLLVFGFSEQIVFPGLERLIGIETIVGKENVVYNPDGDYVFTNPRAMVKWVSATAMVGLLIGAFGVWFSGIRFKSPPRSRG